MTPQILLDALRKAFLHIETVCLIIIDECHRATGNHPYAKIMKVSARELFISLQFIFHVFLCFSSSLAILFPFECEKRCTK